MASVGPKSTGTCRIHEATKLFPCVLERASPVWALSSGQVQSEVKLDPGDLPLFILGQAGPQPVWIESQFQGDAILGDLPGTHIFGDPTIAICVFNHAEHQPWPDLCGGVGCHAAPSPETGSPCEPRICRPLNRDSMVSCALRDRSAARRPSCMRRRKAWASARESSDGTKQSVDSIMDEFRYSRYWCGYHRQANRHGFHQHVGNSIAIAVLQDSARQAKGAGPLNIR